MKKVVWIVVSVIFAVFLIWLIYSFQGDISSNSVGDLDLSGKSYIDVDSSEAYELITMLPNMIIIDVSPNYDEGHIPGAVNYYVGDGSLDEAIFDLDPEEIYLVYCHVDSASRSGAQKLIDAGFENVYRLSDHYGGWVASGYSVEY